MRSTRVLTKKPTRSSNSVRLRPAVGTPNATSSLGDLAAVVAGHHRVGPIGGQLQQALESPQLVFPVAHLPGEHAVLVRLVAEGPVLPERIVGVLRRKRRPGRRGPGAAGPVGGEEVADERRQGRPVPGDVVHRQREPVLGGRHREQPGPEGHFGRQVELVPHDGGGLLVQLPR
nr:hypothetical protein [Streptomyces sp. NRRL S-1868]